MAAGPHPGYVLTDGPAPPGLNKGLLLARITFVLVIVDGELISSGGLYTRPYVLRGQDRELVQLQEFNKP